MPNRVMPIREFESLRMTKYFGDIPCGPFTNIPHKVSKEQYDAATELIISKWQSLVPKPIAIYQIGETTAPGISDLDFVVVFPEGKRVNWKELQPQSFPVWVQELMTHPPYCCTEDSWPDLLGWFPIFSLKYLWGETLPEPSIANQFTCGCALGFLIDYLIVKVPRDFLWLAWEHPLRVRFLLASLYSFKHTLKLAKRAGINVPQGAMEAVAKVDRLRTAWFGLNDNERYTTLRELCGEICVNVGELIQQIDTQLLRAMSGEPIGIQIQGLLHTDLFYFTDPWNFEGVMQVAYEYYFNTGQITWGNPFSFSQVLAVYADECPIMKKYFRSQGCRLRWDWNGGVWNEGLRYHAMAMVAYAKSAAKLGVQPQKYVSLGYAPALPVWIAVKRYAALFLKGEFRPVDIARKTASKLKRLVLR